MVTKCLHCRISEDIRGYPLLVSPAQTLGDSKTGRTPFEDNTPVTRLEEIKEGSLTTLSIDGSSSQSTLAEQPGRTYSSLRQGLLGRKALERDRELVAAGELFKLLQREIYKAYETFEGILEEVDQAEKLVDDQEVADLALLNIRSKINSTWADFFNNCAAGKEYIEALKKRLSADPLWCGDSEDEDEGNSGGLVIISEAVPSQDQERQPAPTSIRARPRSFSF